MPKIGGFPDFRWLVPDFFIKRQNWASLYKLSEMLQNLFLLYIQVEFYQNLLKLMSWLLVFSFYKTFLKWQKKSGTSLSASFYALILTKNVFLRYILLIDQISLPDFLYFLRYWAICILELFFVRSVTS